MSRGGYIASAAQLHVLSTVKLSSLCPLVLAVAGLGCLLPVRAHAQTASQLYTDALQSLQAGDVADAKHKLQLTLEIDKNFAPASALLKRINLMQQQPQPGGQGAAAPVPLGTLRTLAFPVEFKETSLPTALEYIRQQVETASGGKAEVNFVLQLPPDLASRKVTLRLNHVPVMDVLHYIGDLVGVSFQVQQYAIAVVPATAVPASAEPAGASPHP